MSDVERNASESGAGESVDDSMDESAHEDHDHTPAPDEDYSVSPLELFFDLVFVFAFTQVTALLGYDLSWAGLVRGATLLLVVWWSWVGYSWLTNSIRVDDIIPARLVIFAVMCAVLVMGLAIPQAFDDDGVLFGFSYFTATALFVLLYFVATRDRPEMHRAVALMAPGVLAAPVLVVIAGFLDEGPMRAILWGIAILVTLGAPLVAGSQGWHVRPEHFAERHGLIIIIALGESLVALGLSASEEPKTFTVVTASVVGVVLVAAMWWIYFDFGSHVAELALRRAEGADRNAMARDVYSYLHFFMVVGIVFVALGLKKALLDVSGPLDIIASVGLFGGVALYLAAHIGVRLRTFGGVSPVRLGATILLVCAIPVGAVIPAYASVGAVLVILLVLIAVTFLASRETRHRVRYHSR